MLDPSWKNAFARQRKDHRYFQIVETTLNQGFVHAYFRIEEPGKPPAFAPYFVHDQDVFQGSGPFLMRMASMARPVASTSCLRVASRSALSPTIPSV